MPRSGSLFVALCMVAIALSVAALCFLVGGVEAGLSLSVGLAVLLVMVLAHLGAELGAQRREQAARVNELGRVMTETSQELFELTRRLERFETLAMDKARLATEPIAQEIDALGTLVHQFARTLDAHEQAITKVASPARRAALAPDAAPVAAPAPAAAPPQERKPPTITVGPLAGMTEAEAAAAIAGAIGAGRIDLYLQPIVTLPQRKVRWYEASLRIRLPDGTQLSAPDYRPIAMAGGLGPLLDTEAITRSLQVGRRLISRNRDVGLICGIDGASLGSVDFASSLLDLLENEEEMKGALLFEVAQADLRAFTLLELETLRTAGALGFRLALGGVTDLSIEPRDLAEKGVRQVRISADLLLRDPEAAGAAIHPADLAGLFARHGIDLVATELNAESTVVDVLDYDVKFGQGLLFSPPRPVRADVLTAQPEPAPAARTTARPQAPREEPPQRQTPAQRLAPDTLGGAALAAGALGGRSEQRRSLGGLPQGLRSLVKPRG
ncbi:MAG: EAL domain-containing protein [Alphaproteobacteria bacterium]